jgi:glycosyltransferase involved in cell wall biosynthesis
MSTLDVFLHDLAFQWGGAERVLRNLVNLNPVAPVAVIAGDPALLAEHFPHRRRIILHRNLRSNLAVRMATPCLARTLPHRRLPFERLTVSSYAMARWLPSPNPRLIYCHAPMRQIWHGESMYAGGHGVQAVALRLLGGSLRMTDRSASCREDVVVVPSGRSASLIKATYGISPHSVVPPPVGDEVFHRPLVDPEDYFVWCGRIVEPVKRLQLLLEAFARCPRRRLVIVGEGRDRMRLERTAPPNVTFAGWLKGRKLWDTMAKATALLLPSMEDFGMVGAEALATGVPVFSTRQAGIADWIRHGANGLVLEPTVESFTKALGCGPDGFATRPEIRTSARYFASSAYGCAMRSAAADLDWV